MNATQFGAAGVSEGALLVVEGQGPVGQTLTVTSKLDTLLDKLSQFCDVTNDRLKAQEERTDDLSRGLEEIKARLEQLGGKQPPPAGPASQKQGSSKPRQGTQRKRPASNATKHKQAPSKRQMRADTEFPKLPRSTLVEFKDKLKVTAGQRSFSVTEPVLRVAGIDPNEYPRRMRGGSHRFMISCQVMQAIGEADS